LHDKIVNFINDNGNEIFSLRMDSFCGVLLGRGLRSGIDLHKVKSQQANRGRRFRQSSERASCKGKHLFLTLVPASGSSGWIYLLRDHAINDTTGMEFRPGPVAKVDKYLSNGIPIGGNIQ
jgi:hypothetical protein